MSDEKINTKGQLFMIPFVHDTDAREPTRPQAKNISGSVDKTKALANTWLSK